MEERSGTKGFAPVWAPHSRALVLGSYPSPKSFEAGFYYGHPQNRFWPLLALLAGRPVPRGTGEKRALVLACGLALWDSLESCRITGAADHTIRDAVPNRMAPLLARTQIEAVFCNGAAAYTYYMKYCRAEAGLNAVRLPSTSPANAAWGLERLAGAWAPLREYIIPPGGAG